MVLVEDMVSRKHARITVEPLQQGAASRVTFALDFEGPGIGSLFVPQVRRIAAKQAPRRRATGVLFA